MRRLYEESKVHIYIFNLLLISFSMECPEAIERGRNFRLLAEEELSKLLDFLTGYLPNSLKVLYYSVYYGSFFIIINNVFSLFMIRF